MLRGLARAAGPRHGALRPRASGSGVRVPVHVVDLRSDAVTKPGPAMRRAMAEAVVGDDDYGGDPTVRELQEKAATLLGVDRTSFVPTNTMANLISVMCHCQRRGSQLLLGQECHLHVYEQGEVAQVRRLAQSCGVRGHLDGARLLNAAVALHVPPAHVVEHCDSVPLCFSKLQKPPAASQTQDEGGCPQ